MLTVQGCAKNGMDAILGNTHAQPKLLFSRTPKQQVSGMERILRLRRPNDAPFGGRSSHHEYSSQQHQQQQQQQDTPMGAPAGGAEATTNTPSSRWEDL
eukprot:scaffold43079_cov20-Tisochrysis_lutea.AAC.1